MEILQILVLTNTAIRRNPINPGTINRGTTNPGTLNPGTINPGTAESKQCIRETQLSERLLIASDRLNYQRDY